MADGLPIVNVIFVIFGFISNIFKMSSRNKKLTELLFENLKKIKINNKIAQDKFIKLKKVFDKNVNVNKNIEKDNFDFIKNKNLSDISSLVLYRRIPRRKIFDKIEKKNTLENKTKTKALLPQNISSMNSIINNNIIKDNNNIDNSFRLINKDLFSDFNDNSNDIKIENNNEAKNESNINKVAKSHYVKKTLFPYRYYLCTIFIRNINSSEKSLFLTKKFIVVYNFICQLFDISSYLILQKEFEIMKNTILVDKYRHILENRKKINVNEMHFNYNMKECLNSKRLSILGRLNKY